MCAELSLADMDGDDEPSIDRGDVRVSGGCPDHATADRIHVDDSGIGGAPRDGDGMIHRVALIGTCPAFFIARDER